MCKVSYVYVDQQAVISVGLDCLPKPVEPVLLILVFLIAILKRYWDTCALCSLHI